MSDPVLNGLLAAARQAGSRIMADWQAGRPATHVRRKDDGSPVTDTDQDAEAIVTAAIRALSPHPVIAEEEAHAGLSPMVAAGAPFWLVDALDGTRDFVRGMPNFTVNIALIEGGVPTFGIIYAPAHGILWHAQKGAGATRIDIQGNASAARVRPVPQAGMRVLAGSRAATPEALAPFTGTRAVAERVQVSSSMKFCLVAEGSADIYARPGQTYEWDTAAGDIILREAGGAVIDMESMRPIAYGKTQARYENNGFIAAALGALTFEVR